MVSGIGFLFVLHNIAVGEAFVHHAPVKCQIELLVLNERTGEVVEIDLAEGADEQTEHAQRRGRGTVGEHLIGEQQVGAQLKVAGTVDDALDAVARGLESGHGIVAVAVEDHAQETVDELMVLQPAVTVVTARFGGTGAEFASAHEWTAEQTVEHLASDVGVKAFVLHKSGTFFVLEIFFE